MNENRLPREHGSERGYRQHYLHGEPTCEPCREAHRRFSGWYRKTTQTAINHLIGAHPEEYDELLRRARLNGPPEGAKWTRS